MKKDIYIIKNNINDKVYIGQSVNANDRWKRHISDAKNRQPQRIHKAMQKYGIENFHYEILESQIENYDEREKYWIKYYNSLIPNGYNILPGGQEILRNLDEPNNLIKDPNKLNEIINLIQNTTMSFQAIAKKYSTEAFIISAINFGKGAYRNLNFKYPLRNNIHKYSEEKFKQLVYSLKYELDKTLTQIAKEYNVDPSNLSEINTGKAHRVDWLTYPIRKGRKQDILKDNINKIIDLLLNTDMPQKDIARKFNVSAGSISSINKGLSYKQENLTYPLRTNYQCCNGGRKSFSPKEIKEIENLLKESKVSLKQIAKEYETTFQQISNINNGAIKKYKNLNETYPLRK